MLGVEAVFLGNHIGIENEAFSRIQRGGLRFALQMHVGVRLGFPQADRFCLGMAYAKPIFGGRS